MRKSSPVSLHTDNYNNINLCLVNSGTHSYSSPRSPTFHTLAGWRTNRCVLGKALYKKQTLLLHRQRPVLHTLPAAVHNSYCDSRITACTYITTQYTRILTQQIWTDGINLRAQRISCAFCPRTLTLQKWQVLKHVRKCGDSSPAPLLQ